MGGTWARQVYKGGGCSRWADQKGTPDQADLKPLEPTTQDRSSLFKLYICDFVYSTLYFNLINTVEKKVTVVAAVGWLLSLHHSRYELKVERDE